jgi:glutamate formiminotransferase
MELVECVPNFSEGRDQKKIEAIVYAASSVLGVTILDVENDADHNRSVLSFIAPPEAAFEACFRLAQKSAELIDLNFHKGEHPRMGAVDVIPFIPVSGTSLAECRALAERLGEKIGRELQIPVYLYGEAAKNPARKDLAAVRKGQFEGLKDLIGKDPERVPDFGPNKIHPTAGAVAVGARGQIVNFNINLDLKNLEAGKDIAKRLRASGGGLPAVRAKEIFLQARNQVQISTVLTDYKTTGIARVLDEASKLATEKGAQILTTEIVGLLPREALVDFALDSLKLENFNADIQILERRLEGRGQKNSWSQAGKSLISALASSEPTPGGGSAAAIVGGMGCGLALMAVAVTLKSKKLDISKRPSLNHAQEILTEIKNQLENLAEEDAKAFDQVMAVFSISKEDPSRRDKIDEALIKAAEVPLATARAAAQALQEARQVLGSTQSSVLSDLNCAIHLFQAAIRCAAENVKINIDSLSDKSKTAPIKKAIDDCLKTIAQN